MSRKSKYFKVFGLSETASKAEIRKAYRKLAMQYHPDKNPDPKAHKIFIDLADAYAILMDDKEEVVLTTQQRKTQSFDERRKEAEHRYKRQQEREQKEQDAYFRRLTSGRKWKLYRFYAYFTFILGFILLFEPLLPSHFEEHEIKAISGKYDGLIRDEVICIKTDKDLKVFVKNPYFSIFSNKPEVQIERSFIFRNPIYIWYQTYQFTKKFEVDFSVRSLYPMITILFSIPLLTYRFRRKNYWFTLGYLVSNWLILPCVLYFLFSQDRWAHLLTFGFL